MAEAILLFAGDNVWSQDLDRKTKYWIHGVLLITSTVIIVVGNSIAFYYVKTIPHFSTAHGLTGKHTALFERSSYIPFLDFRFYIHVARFGILYIGFWSC